MTTREHDTTSEDPRTCWCKPEVFVPCDECDEPPAPGCWACGGKGLIPVLGDPSTYDGPHAFVVLHRELTEVMHVAFDGDAKRSLPPIDKDAELSRLQAETHRHRYNR